MSVDTIERMIGRGVGIGGAAALAYSVWADQSRNARLERVPKGGLQQSLVPFYSDLPDIAEACGIAEYASSGGLAKQALTDPDTEFDPANRQYAVTNPNSATVKKASLFRAGEGTRRDFDIRVFRILVDGEIVDAESSFEGKGGIKEERKAKMQKMLNERAEALGMPFGPELSLFFYEEPFGPFRPWHYATRTVFDPSTNQETIFATTGQNLIQERDDLWKCVIDLPKQETIIIPVNSPVTHLGRTLVRPLVERQRDRTDVEDAVINIRAKGLGDEILGQRWKEFVEYRKLLDVALNSDKIYKKFRAGAPTQGLNMLFARLVVPLAPIIEKSEIGAVIRDPGHPIGRLSARTMGA